MKTRLVFSLLTLAVLSGCGVPPSADHHQHLMSPAAAESASRPPLRAVELPPDLARLLAQRAERWRDAASLKELYTPDAWVLS